MKGKLGKRDEGIGEDFRISSLQVNVNFTLVFLRIGGRRRLLPPT